MTQKAEEVLARLDKIPEPTLSVRQFIIMNFDALRQSGKTLKALYHFLLANGIDIGAYESFQAIYNRVRRSRELTSRESAPLAPEKAAPADKVSGAPRPQFE